jgi:histidine triad (HIT) family protein
MPRQSKLFDNEESIEDSKLHREGKESTACAFCEILSKVEGGEEREVFFRDETTVAFLDRRPIFLGHTLVVPITHYENLFEVPAELIEPLFKNVQLISKAVKLAMNSDGVFNAINNKVSQSVPHLHIHVVPRKFHDGLRGFWPRQKYDGPKQMKEISSSISAAIEELTLKSRSALPSRTCPNLGSR